MSEQSAIGVKFVENEFDAISSIEPLTNLIDNLKDDGYVIIEEVLDATKDLSSEENSDADILFEKIEEQFTTNLSEMQECEKVEDSKTTRCNYVLLLPAISTTTSKSTVLYSNNNNRPLQHKGPKRFLLFDNLIAEIVDYDEDDETPIVEFSMCITKDDENNLPVECGICPDIMHKSQLNKHIKTHLKPGTKRFNCIYCDESSVSRSYAAGHARRHKGIRPYVCLQCKMYYCTSQDLRMHQQRRHIAKQHICEQCGKTFAQSTELKNHRMLVHEQQKRFDCELCGKRYLRKYAMKEHVRNIHMRDRRLLDCPFCGQCFKDAHKLAQHRKSEHLQQSQFDCRECGMEFNSIYFFDAHRRSIQCRNKYKQRELQLKKENELRGTTRGMGESVDKQSLQLQQIHKTQDEEEEERKEMQHSMDEEILHEITVDSF